MPAVFTSHDKGPRDLALAAIKEALGSVGQTEQNTVQLEDKKKGADKRDPADVRNLVARLLGKPLRARIVPRRLAGLLSSVCIGVAVLAWQSSGGQVAPEPLSTSSVPKKEELRAQPVSHNSDFSAKTSASPQVQGPPQSAPIGPTTVSTDPTLARQIQDIANEVAKVAEAIDQLKTEQSQIAHENVELADGLKATSVAVRHNAELAEDLKVTQSQLAREISNLADQLRASQDLMASVAVQLKEAQEQVARIASPEQRLRPKPLASSQPTAVNVPRRAVPKPPAPVAAQTQGQSQPKQR